MLGNDRRVTGLSSGSGTVPGGRGNQKKWFGNPESSVVGRGSG